MDSDLQRGWNGLLCPTLSFFPQRSNNTFLKGQENQWWTRSKRPGEFPSVWMKTAVKLPCAVWKVLYCIPLVVDGFPRVMRTYNPVEGLGGSKPCPLAVQPDPLPRTRQGRSQGSVMCGISHRGNVHFCAQFTTLRVKNFNSKCLLKKKLKLFPIIQFSFFFFFWNGNKVCLLQ